MLNPSSSEFPLRKYYNFDITISNRFLNTCEWNMLCVIRAFVEDVFNASNRFTDLINIFSNDNCERNSEIKEYFIDMSKCLVTSLEILLNAMKKYVEDQNKGIRMKKSENQPLGKKDIEVDDSKINELKKICKLVEEFRIEFEKNTRDTKKCLTAQQIGSIIDCYNIFSRWLNFSFYKSGFCLFFDHIPHLNIPYDLYNKKFKKITFDEIPSAAYPYDYHTYRYYRGRDLDKDVEYWFEFMQDLYSLRHSSDENMLKENCEKFVDAMLKNAEYETARYLWRIILEQIMVEEKRSKPSILSETNESGKK